MTALAPRIGLLDAMRAERLDRRTDALTAGRDFDERRSRTSIEAVRIECPRDRFEVADSPT
jgi:hypothetical protein